jgi:hypothetical protein
MWKAWGTSGDSNQHYFIASKPDGPWTDQGINLESPTNGGSHDYWTDPQVRRLPGSNGYVMVCSSASFLDIGILTSPDAALGNWTLQHGPLFPYRVGGVNAHSRTDPCPFVSSGGDLVIVYAASQNATGSGLQIFGPGGLAVYDRELGAWFDRRWVTVPDPSTWTSGVNIVGSPVLMEFAAGRYTLLWAESPSDMIPPNGSGGFGYGAVQFGPPVMVQESDLVAQAPYF